MTLQVAEAPTGPRTIYRHSVIVRVAHWINVLCLTILLMSGLQIFNAHPALYIGKQSSFDSPVLSIGARENSGARVGTTTILGHSLETTGFLGLSNDRGEITARAFPSWITIPTDQDLATGRRWHFLFAWIFAINGALYLAHGFLSRHFSRDLVPTRAELAGFCAAVRNHLRLRFPHGDEARRYNVLQILSYLAVIFLLLPLMVAAGLAMSPAMNSAFPWLVDFFGGRQTARTIHFVGALLLTLFVIAHVAMVLLSGVWNNLVSMITGRYRLN